MSYQRVKCPRGHSFMASVYSRHQRITCPDCDRNARSAQAALQQPRSDDPLFQSPTDPGFSPSFDVSETFRSGGGGDFGGGGASGGWDAPSPAPAPSYEAPAPSPSYDSGSSGSDSGSSYSSD